MGKKSTKENKNIYQTSREDAGLTREKASELMDFVSADRIEKIAEGNIDQQKLDSYKKSFQFL